VAKADANREIGVILFIGVFIVKNHMRRFFMKLKVKNCAQAVGELTLLKNHG
jgi:DNA-binding CsgD family transcriptional regulator